MGIVHYFLQLIWYMGMGVLGLATPWVSLHDLAMARKSGPAELT